MLNDRLTKRYTVDELGKNWKTRSQNYPTLWKMSPKRKTRILHTYWYVSTTPFTLPIKVTRLMSLQIPPSTPRQEFRHLLSPLATLVLSRVTTRRVVLASLKKPLSFLAIALLMLLIFDPFLQAKKHYSAKRAKDAQAGLHLIQWRPNPPVLCFSQPIQTIWRLHRNVTC